MKTEKQVLNEIKDLVNGLNEGSLLFSVLGMVGSLIEDGNADPLDLILRDNFPDYYLEPAG